jgi:hypothetical protein
MIVGLEPPETKLPKLTMQAGKEETTGERKKGTIKRLSTRTKQDLKGFLSIRIFSYFSFNSSGGLWGMDCFLGGGKEAELKH